MKKMLNTLIRRSFAANRARNLIAVLAITLTAVLFTSVTTIAMGTLEAASLTMQLQKGTRSDGELRYMTAEQFAQLENADFIEEYGLRMPVGFLADTKRHNIEFDVLDETQADLSFCMPSHGEAPKAANEIVASNLALAELGAAAEVGARVEITFTAHGKEYTFPMVVSGWYEASSDQVSLMWAGTAFRDANPDIFAYTYREDHDMAGTYWTYLTARSVYGLQENLHGFIRSIGGEPEDMEAANYIPAVINSNPPLSSNNLPILLAGAGVVVLFIFCGYLVIFNVFDIAVMQEIRRYGLYRTIGMGKKQVKRLINRQALWLSCIGIPVGLLLGFFTGKAALPVIMDIMSNEYDNVSVHVTPSPIIFIGAALLTAFTIFISTRKPARTAAEIPPIEAFRYVESSAGRRTSKKSSFGTSIPRLSFSNLGRNKRRTAFIFISLALCVVLLNSAGSAAMSVDVEKMVSFFNRTDFSVVNTAALDVTKGFTSRSQKLKQQTMDDISAQPGVLAPSAIYKNTIEDTNVTYGFGTWDYTDLWTDPETGLPHASLEQGLFFTLGEDGNPMCNVFGMDETSFSRMEIREGETDPHTLYEKIQNGEGIMAGIRLDPRNMDYWETFNYIDVGDMVTLYKDGEPLMELPVLAKAALSTSDTRNSNGNNDVGGDAPMLYMTDALFKKIYDQPTIYRYDFDVEEGQQEAMSAYLDDYMTVTDPSMNYDSAQKSRETAQSTQTMLYFVGGLLGVIFGIAGILNLINTIITTILTRRHEFATMQSIGMTEKQLRKMLVLESLYYGAGACVIGLFVSAAACFALIRPATGAIWYFTFHFTLIPALITCVVLLITAAIVPVIALKAFNKGSIVEKLRVAE